MKGGKAWLNEAMRQRAELEAYNRMDLAKAQSVCRVWRTTPSAQSMGNLIHADLSAIEARMQPLVDKYTLDTGRIMNMMAHGYRLQDIEQLGQLIHRLQAQRGSPYGTLPEPLVVVYYRPQAHERHRTCHAFSTQPFMTLPHRPGKQRKLPAFKVWDSEKGWVENLPVVKPP